MFSLIPQVTVLHCTSNLFAIPGLWDMNTLKVLKINMAVK